MSWPLFKTRRAGDSHTNHILNRLLFLNFNCFGSPLPPCALLSGKFRVATTSKKSSFQPSVALAERELEPPFYQQVVLVVGKAGFQIAREGRAFGMTVFWRNAFLSQFFSRFKKSQYATLFSPHQTFSGQQCPQGGRRCLYPICCYITQILKPMVKHLLSK